MPNWCYNSITIQGPKEDLDKFIQAVTLPKSSDLGTEYDLTLPYPTPKELAETPSVFYSDPDKQSEQAKIEQANLDKYGYKNWYDWNIAHWGTKWPPRVEEFDLDDAQHDGLWSIHALYETAWCPPTKLIQKLSELFPTLVFHTSFDEESQAFVGCEIFSKGQEFSAGFEPGTAEVPEGYAERWNAIKDKFDNNDDDAFQDLLDYQSDLKEVAEKLAWEEFEAHSL